ncbi:hypothetical protein E2I00_018918 [Balaenoptera physalus]|uniref:Protein chibby homolog 2 n=1 Tax=Balaenoptera physalus TaxID=9770 RepID=A0A643CF11_BALPH|nr:hypothetical protein E2I00_018918 [Balaenoptera physalus]
MSPLECSECFGDQLLHRTYTWHLTLHSRPNFTRKRDTRSESLEIPINVVLPQRGSAEPFLRLHNLYPTPRCARQAALPRLSRRAVSQHSYPPDRFPSVPLDPMESPTPQADPALDCDPPRVQLSDETFVFQDGRWEENRALQEENRALHVLREEHRIFQEESKALWENNKLKLQQKLVIDTVTEVTARMEMLIEELYAFMPTKNNDPKKPSRV